MPHQLHLRLKLGVVRDARVLGAVPDHSAAVGAHGGHHVRVLRLVARLVDLARVVDLLHDRQLDLHGRRLLRARRPAAVASNFFALLIVVGRVRCDGVWDLDLCELEVVGDVVAGVRADEESVHGVVLARDAVPRRSAG